MQLVSLYRHKARKISLTALIDVVFILLMFFMLTSSFSQWKAVDFNSPAVSNEPVDEQPVALVLRADSSMQTADNSVDIAAKQSIPVHAFTANKPLILIPQADTPVQIIISRFEEIKQHGLVITLGSVKQPDAEARGER
jgi:biopolymer transport protein ExbD